MRGVAGEVAGPVAGEVRAVGALQLPVSTLYNWRASGTGPQSIKVGKYIRYRPAAVEAYLASLEPR